MGKSSRRAEERAERAFEAERDIAPKNTAFYEGINVQKLDDEDFAQFWQDLAAKNRRHFYEDESDSRALDELAAAGMLSLSGFDSTYLLPGFGLVATDVPSSEAAERLKKLLSGRLCNQEINRRTLEFCREQRTFAEVEEAITAFPEFETATQSPYRFIKGLVEAGGLRRASVDSEGNEITLADVAALSEDEIDDRIDHFELLTTEAGAAAARELSPERKLKNLIQKFPDRISVYRDLLTHVKSTPCNYAEIENLFAGRDFSGLRTIGMEKHVALKPSVFVDNMEKAGGLVWKGGRWNITREGEALLGQLVEKGTLG